MKKYMLLSLVFVANLLIAQVSKTVNLTDAGTLKTAVTAAEKTTISHFILTGSMDARDFKTLRDDFTALNILDLSGVTIASYEETSGTFTSYTYPANEIPPYSFCNFQTGVGKNTLTSVFLPQNAKSVAIAAFKNCKNLQNVKIPASIDSIKAEVFSGCSALSSIFAFRAIPVDITKSTNLFYQVDFTKCSLYTLFTAMNVYKQADVWKNFTKVFSLTPTVNTISVSDIQLNSAKIRGEVLNQGVSNVTSRGICWSKTENPTFSDAYVVEGAGAGQFVVPITLLQTGTTYYFRAYATNSEGTTFGNVMSFKTLSLPIPVTNPAGSISASWFTLSGYVYDQGSTPVTETGFCWSVNTNPTKSDSTIIAKLNGVNFTARVDSMAQGTTYYIRSYALNQQGISYGNEIEVKTLADSKEIFMSNIAFVSNEQLKDTLKDIPENMAMNSLNPYNFINPGHVVRFKTEVTNNKKNGSSVVSGLCRISCNDPFITLNDSISGLNNLDWEKTGWSTDEFEIMIDPKTPAGYVANFTFIFKEGNNQYLTYELPLLVNPMVLQENQVDDDDNPDSNGNNNSICEPGEIVECMPVIKNVSPYEATKLSGTFDNFYRESGISIWKNKEGSSGKVVNNSYWKYLFGEPQVVLVNDSNLYPRWDFVFEYLYKSTFNFKLGVAMAGHFPLIKGKQNRISWIIPVEFNKGFPEVNTGTDSFEVDVFKVFPNPTSGRFIISYSSSLSDAHIQILNTSGQLVYSAGLKRDRTIMDLSSFNFSGMYFFRLLDSEQKIIGIKKVFIDK